MSKKPPRPQSDWIRFSSLGFQLVIIIGGFAFLGNYLDGRSENEKPIWTAVLALLGVVLGIVYLLVEVNRISKK